MAAPKGNKYAVGLGGRSKTFESPEQLEEYIEEYFDLCDANVVVKGIQGTKTEPYTIEGLALHLNLTRQSLINYEKSPGYEDYFDTIKRAKLRVQKNKVVSALVGATNAAVTIFDLKNNHGYKDKQEVANTVEITKGLSKEEIKEIDDALDNDY